MRLVAKLTVMFLLVVILLTAGYGILVVNRHRSRFVESPLADALFAPNPFEMAFAWFIRPASCQHNERYTANEQESGEEKPTQVTRRTAMSRLNHKRFLRIWRPYFRIGDFDVELASAKSERDGGQRALRLRIYVSATRC